MRKILSSDLFHLGFFPKYKPKIQNENDYNILGKDSHALYNRAPSLRSINYDFILHNQWDLSRLKRFFCDKGGRSGRFWLLDYTPAFEVVSANGAIVRVKNTLSENALSSQRHYYIISPNAKPEFSFLRRYNSTSPYSDNVPTYYVYELISAKIENEQSRILTLDSVINNTSLIPNFLQTGADVIEAYKGYFPSYESKYLFEIIPVRFDSDSLNVNYKTARHFEVSLKFKEILL